MKKLLTMLAIVFCMLSASTVYAAETDSGVLEEGQVRFDQMNGCIVNKLELDQYYYVHELEQSDDPFGDDNEYYIKLNIPEDGRIKVEIEDYTEDVFPDGLNIPTVQSSQIGAYVYRYWKDNNMKRDSGWITVKSGMYIPRFYAYSVNEEAKMIVRYQKSAEYNGETEDNDTFDDADILLSGVKYEGDYSKENDIDVYKMQLTNPGAVQLSCSGIAAYSALYKEDVHGNVTDMYDLDEISKIRLGAGVYYFEILPNTPDAYFRRTAEYSIQADVTYESEDQYEQEPNNVISQANLKKVNVSYTGNLNDANDYDLYKFEVPKGRMALEFTIPRQRTPDSIKVSLLDDLFNELDSYENTSNPYYISKSILHDAGTYYVKVESGSSNQVMTEDYTVNLNNTDYVYVSRITLPKERALYKGKSLKLNAGVTPENAMNRSIKWSSSNSSVASVDRNGNVTAKNVGTAVIKAAAQDGSGVCAYTTIKVSIPIKLNKSSVSGYVGKNFTLKLSGTNGTEKWKSSKKSIVAVNAKGVVTCKKIGTAKITATYKGKTYSCTVTVKPTFKKGTWFAYPDGGYCFKIHSIQGNKMTYSFYMPSVSVKKKTAVIQSNGKKAKASFKCKNKKTHSLVITVSGNTIKVTETSSCKNKLLDGFKPNKKKKITHSFHTEEYFYGR